MLFFRSEELASEWCRAKGVPRRPLVRMDQLWTMSVTWYGTRLDPDSRRPAPAEIRGIFAGIGLDDPFWDPLDDSFAT